MKELRDLILAVKEEHLSKDSLEKYRDSFSNLFAQIHLEMADLEKAEALYFIANRRMVNTDKGIKERTDISIKRDWKATPEGQKLIELDHSSKACEKMLSSLKSRLYSMY